MKKMQTEVVNKQLEESEIVTEKLYSSCEDGVNTMGSLVNDPTCWGNNKDATCGKRRKIERKTTRCCGLRAKIGVKNEKFLA